MGKAANGYNPIERIQLRMEADRQLHERNCVEVITNPFSFDLYPFVRSVIYSLGWGGSGNMESITTSFSEGVDIHVAVINITLRLHVKGEKRHVVMSSKWTQRGSVITADNRCNNDSIGTENFRISEAKYSNATVALKRLLKRSLIKLSAYH